jgi:hypothetical protein
MATSEEPDGRSHSSVIEEYVRMTLDEQEKETK